MFINIIILSYLTTCTTINNFIVHIYEIYSKTVYLCCIMYRMRYNSKKVMRMAVNYTWKLDHLS